MTIPIIILSVPLLILIWVLFIPFNITINTDHKNYRAYIPGLVGIWLITENEQFKLKGNLFFFRFYIKQKMAKQDTLVPNMKAGKERTLSTKNFPAFIKKASNTGRKILNAFKIKRLMIDIDTGDFPLNAQLFPVAVLAQNKGYDLKINFENRNHLDLNMRIRLFFIAYYGLEFYIKNKYLFTKN